MRLKHDSHSKHTSNSKHTFHTEEPKSKHVDQNRHIDVDVNTQVIVCGVYASHFLSGINDGALTFNEEETYPAFIYSVKGKIDIHAQLDLTSKINYTETHKKKANAAIDYKHDDHIKHTSESNKFIDDSFQNSKADFKSPNNTWVILAVTDVNEQKAIKEDIKKLIGQNRLKLYEFRTVGITYEEDFDLFSSRHANYISNPKEIKNAAKEFEKTLKKDIGKHLETQEKEWIEQLETNTKKEIEQEIHQEANKYFEEKDKQSCLVM